jgi:hypothetical protein
MSGGFWPLLAAAFCAAVLLPPLLGGACCAAPAAACFVARGVPSGASPSNWFSAAA